MHAHTCEDAAVWSKLFADSLPPHVHVQPTLLQWAAKLLLDLHGNRGLANFYSVCTRLCNVVGPEKFKWNINTSLVQL